MDKVWNTLVVDDESLARERVKRILHEFPDTFNIIGEAIDSNDARDKIEQLKPDLVFLDIEMPGENIFAELKKLQFQPFIVFCTAYDSYALQAFQTSSVDYIIKPIDQNKIRDTIVKLRKISSNTSNYNPNILEKISNLILNEDIPRSIPYRIGDKTIFIKLSQIVYFQANDKYVNFFDAQGKEYLTDICLKTLEDKLKRNFLRISKSVIVNKELIKEVHKYFRGKFTFYMVDMKNTKLISGSYYNENIKNIFNL